MADAIDKATFTVDDQNHITIQSEGAELAHGLTHFRSQQEFEALAAKWAASKLVDLWNQVPGSAPVKKFTNRSIAIRRIWALLEGATRPEHARPIVKPKAGRSNKKALPTPRA